MRSGLESTAGRSTSEDGFPIAPGSRIVFAGDSITDAGRTEGRGGALGQGYVADIVRMLTARRPELHLELVNTGVNGFSSRDLLGRWQEDVLARDPNWVSLLVGINDCRQTMFHDDRGVDADEYASNCLKIVEATVTRDIQMVLVDPFYMCEPGRADDDAIGSLLRELTPYVETVGALAEQFGLRRVRAGDLFRRQLAHRPLAELGPDSVHPTVAGHVALALGWLQALDW